MSDWLDDIERRATDTANDDTAHEDSADWFITTTFAMAMGRTLKNSPPVAERWYPHLVRDAIQTLDTELLPQLCRAHDHRLSQVGQPFPEMHVQLAVTTVAVATSDDPPGHDHDDRVARVATVLETTLHLIWQESNLKGEHFDAIVTAVEKLESESPSLYSDLVEEVPERLDANHDDLVAALDWREAFRCVLWSQSSGSTRWIKRCLGGRKPRDVKKRWAFLDCMSNHC